MNESRAPRPSSTIDPAEVARFGALAEEWWDPRGKFRPIHKFNPVRLEFIKAEVCRHFGRDPRAADAYAGLRLLDIGCGGGLACEPAARLGAAVTGIDPSPETIAAARLHAERSGLEIDYRADTAEALAEAGERFDVVLALEVVEHVADVPLFLRAVSALAQPGGLVVVATLNRTLRAYALAIVGAEYVLRWLPRGTHDWRKFLTPDELRQGLAEAGLAPAGETGLVYDPLADRWRLAADMAVNYMLTAGKPAG